MPLVRGICLLLPLTLGHFSGHWSCCSEPAAWGPCVAAEFLHPDPWWVRAQVRTQGGRNPACLREEGCYRWGRIPVRLLGET